MQQSREMEEQEMACGKHQFQNGGIVCQTDVTWFINGLKLSTDSDTGSSKIKNKFMCHVMRTRHIGVEGFKKESLVLTQGDLHQHTDHRYMNMMQHNRS